MNNEELQQLKALAEAATPGPWERSGLGCGIVGLKASNGQWAFASDDSEQNWQNAGFTAAANPVAILALIAKVESLAADAERYKWLRDKANAPIDEAIDRFDPMVFRCHPKHPLSWDGVSVGAELDEVVDAAMAKEKA